MAAGCKQAPNAADRGKPASARHIDEKEVLDVWVGDKQLSMAAFVLRRFATASAAQHSTDDRHQSRWDMYRR